MLVAIKLHGIMSPNTASLTLVNVTVNASVCLGSEVRELHFKEDPRSRKDCQKAENHATAHNVLHAGK